MIVNAVVGGVVGGVIQAAKVVLTTDTARPGKRTSSPLVFDSLKLILPTAIPTRRSTILGAETTATPSSRPRKLLPMTLPPKQPTAGVVLLPMVGVQLTPTLTLGNPLPLQMLQPLLLKANPNPKAPVAARTKKLKKRITL